MLVQLKINSSLKRFNAFVVDLQAIMQIYQNVTTETANHLKPSATTHPKLSAATEPTCNELETTQTGLKQFISM